MKLIPKKQSGGSFLNYFADYAVVKPVASGLEEAQATTTKSSSGEKGALGEKDYTALLKDIDGLPNEMRYLQQVIGSLFQSSALSGSELDSSILAHEYSQALFEIKNANFNKKEFDKAYNEARANKALNEVAINKGHIVCYDKDKKIQNISLSEFKKNRDKYMPITNGELLALRSQDPDLVYRNDIFEITNNGIGIDKVQTMIKERLGTLGSSDNNYSGTIAKVGDSVAAGIDILRQMSQQEQSNMTLDGMYKSKIITKDQKVQAEKALEYIYSTLPENAQILLALRSNETENLTKGALDTIQSLVMSRMNSTRDVTIEYDDSNSSGKSSKSGTGKGGLLDEDQNVAFMFLAGYGNKESFIVNPGTNIATSVTANSMQLVKKDGTNLGGNCSLQEASEGQFGGILDWNKVTMGGRKVDPSSFNQVLITDGMVRSIDFPVDENGNPDLRPTTLEAKRKADAMIQEAGIDLNDKQSIAQNSQMINDILRECGLQAAYNEDGEIVSGNWKRFAVMNGTADDRALGMDAMDSDNLLLHEIIDDTKINNLLRIMGDKMGLTGKEKVEFDKNDSWIEFGYDRLLEGTIWIPINANYHNAMAGSGQEMSANLNMQLEQRQAHMDRQNMLRSQYVPAEQP